MDGVLVDNAHMHVKSFEVLYDRLGIQDKKDITQFFGFGLKEALIEVIPQEIIEEKGMDFLCYEKERIYREIYAPTIQPISGLIPLLEKFKSKGISCCVGSSGCNDNVNFVLDQCNIRQFFDGQISADDVHHCKPDPEIYLKAAEVLGLRPCDCVVFEDAMSGIESARKAGAGKVIALTTSFPEDMLKDCRPDFIITDFNDFQASMLD